MVRGWMAMVVALGMTAGAASAQEFNGAEQIARGDYIAAEQVIAKQQRMFARDADLRINLAAVYARTGRQADARRLYQAVATAPDEKLDLADRSVAWSHTLAAEGLRRLDRQVAAR